MTDRHQREIYCEHTGWRVAVTRRTVSHGTAVGRLLHAAEIRPFREVAQVKGDAILASNERQAENCIVMMLTVSVQMSKFLFGDRYSASARALDSRARDRQTCC